MLAPLPAVHDLRGIPAEFLDPGALRRQIIRFVADGDRADGGVVGGNREFGAERAQFAQPTPGAEPCQGGASQARG